MRRVLAIAISAVALVGIVCCSSPEGPSEHAETVASAMMRQPAFGTQSEQYSIAQPPIMIAAVGDSIVAWNKSGPLPHSWTKDLATGPVVVNYNDGWAWGGRKLADMAAGIQPIHSDVLVVMGGTNDAAGPPWGTPTASMVASLEQIVAKSGAPADRVIICAIAPLVYDAGPAAAWNTTEKKVAVQHGWTFIDPWAPIRSPSGQYDSGYTFDGIHPTDAGSLILANAIAATVQDVVR